MKSLIAVSVLAVLLAPAQPAPSIPPIPPHHHSSSGGGSHAILVKICNNTLRCFGENCKTYVVPDNHCFTHFPGESLEFSCQAFDTCVKGNQYFGNKCSGGFGGRNFSLPANTCLGQRYVHVSNNEMTMYNCAGSPTCHGGDYTKCTKAFGPDALGSCATMKSPHGFYNISLDLSTDSGSCHEIKVRPFRTSNCATMAPRPSGSPVPAPTTRVEERGAQVQALIAAKAAADQANVVVPPPPAPGHHGNHHGHGRPSHRGNYFFVPEGQCIPRPESKFSVIFSCAHTSSAAALKETIPEATDEVMNLIQANIDESSRFGHHHPHGEEESEQHPRRLGHYRA